jgi:hypothetical protein
MQVKPEINVLRASNEAGHTKRPFRLPDRESIALFQLSGGTDPFLIIGEGLDEASRSLAHQRLSIEA